MTQLAYPSKGLKRKNNFPRMREKEKCHTASVTKRITLNESNPFVRCCRKSCSACDLDVLRGTLLSLFFYFSYFFSSLLSLSFFILLLGWATGKKEANFYEICSRKLCGTENVMYVVQIWINLETTTTTLVISALVL